VNGLHSTGLRGAGQFSTGAFQSADSMKSFQIDAGKVPPATAIPCTLSIGISPPG
jgi:hypothetical protein